VSKPLKAIGLMSGTSLDGIDVAWLETDGEQIETRGPAMTVPYNATQQDILSRAIADAATLEERRSRPGILSYAEKQTTQWHFDAVKTFASKFSINLDTINVVGFHGQTVIHRPEKALTVQLGSGLHLAKKLKIPVVFDMRANDMVHGGQGAPLVPAYHRALVSELKSAPVAVVNIGGVANVTWIGSDGTLVAFDTGPGNALIDDWMKTHTGTARDEGGRLGLVGQVDESVVAQFLGDGFFESTKAKSLDRNSFSGITLGGLSLADGAATLVAVTTRSIALSQKLMPDPPKQWIICGGGRHNRAIMRDLEKLLGNVQKAEALRLDGDAIEAEAWAFLAVRSLRGLPLTYPGTTGVSAPMTGGVLATPE
jgi:anhydro-N-acetylmuramic acid kinase